MRFHATPGRIAAVYTASSFAWILLFDQLVEERVPPFGARLAWDALWGGAYVIATGLLVYVLVLRLSRRSERERTWYTELFAASPDAIFILGADGRISDANDVAVERYGLSREELRTMLLDDLAPTASRAIHRERFAAARAGSGRFESRHVTAVGRRMAVDVAVRPVRRGDEPCLLCTVRDISNLQTALETLRQNEEVQRALVSCSPVALFSLGLDGRVLSWNPSAAALTGWSEEEAVGRPLPIVPSATDEDFVRLRRRVMAGESLAGMHVVRRRRDGSLFTGSLSVAPVRAADGGIVGMMCAMEDVTDRLQSEAALAESERQFRLAVEASPFPIIIHAEDGQIIAVSRSVAGLTGHGPQVLCSMATWTEAAHGEQAPLARAAIARTFREDQAGSREWTVFCRDGTPLTWDFSSTQLGRLPDGRALVITMAADVTARRRAEAEREAIREQLYHAQRIEAVGELAGGVAHDFNNILQAMAGYARLLLDTAPVEGLLREGLEEIHRGTERATALTRQLLAFSRRQVMDQRPVDLGEVVGGMLRMVERLLPSTVEIAFEPAEGLPPILADQGMIEQVVLNLCVNARDAMPDGGTIVVTTTAVALDADGAAGPGPWVLLTVRDTGCGMDAATRGRIFEPFFSTKQRSGGPSGTGLGLATVYGIVKQHDGVILVDSEPGRGAEFRVYLPLVAAADRQAGGTSDAHAAASPGGTETILLAEDDEGARRLAGRILELAGYTVVTAVDGRDALARFEAAAERFDLVVLDLVMPGLAGDEVLARMAAIRPGLPALFVSGQAGAGGARARGRDGGAAAGRLAGRVLLVKPYRPEDLLQAVRHALDGRESASA